MKTFKTSKSPKATPGNASALSQPLRPFAVDPQSSPAAVQKKKNNAGMTQEVRAKMEDVFKTDLSNVKIHTDSPKAQELGAMAFTQGEDIHFAPGHFKPNASHGRKILGHELAHIVQQRSGRVKPTTSEAGLPVNDSNSLEQEADNLSFRAMHAKSNAPQPDAVPAPVQAQSASMEVPGSSPVSSPVQKNGGKGHKKKKKSTGGSSKLARHEKGSHDAKQQKSNSFFKAMKKKNPNITKHESERIRKRKKN